MYFKLEDSQCDPESVGFNLTCRDCLEQMWRIFAKRLRMLIVRVCQNTPFKLNQSVEDFIITYLKCLRMPAIYLDYCKVFIGRFHRANVFDKTCFSKSILQYKASI